MVTQLQSPTQKDIIYPDSDGQPMADNTKQFELIVLIKKNLDVLFANDPNVFVAGDLLWYPIEGDNKTKIAPDVMVVFGRPKGDRGSYQQWQEDNIPPQVVFEILSPGNSLKEMAKKLQFYDRYGVEEYYLYDPDKVDLTGWLRSEDGLEVIEEMAGWVSPRLGIRFELAEGEFVIYRPDGERFATYVELAQRVEQERQRAEQERQRAEQERQRAEQAEAELQALRALLQERGINPNDL
jgi:Uma2 family endonuclease